LEVIRSYKVLDTPPDKELDDIVQIAAFMMDMPISLVSIADENRQWFKAKLGVLVSEVAGEDALFSHVIDNVKNELLIVDDPQKDIRFKDSPLVKENPNMRFYVGAPLLADTGDVLGTLCLIDNKWRTISENHKKALRLLADKVMDILNARKAMNHKNSQLAISAERLEKISDSSPGAFFEMVLNTEGALNFSFMSKGMAELHPSLDLEKIKLDAYAALEAVHPDDVEMLLQKMEESREKMTIWNVDFRIANSKEGNWHKVVARPVKKAEGNIVWYGTFQDITATKKYLNALEDSFFNLSHIMRRPIANLSGITNLLCKSGLSNAERSDLLGYLVETSRELEQCSADLNRRYADIDHNFKKMN